MVGIPTKVVRLVVRTVGVAQGVADVRRFQGDVPVTVDAQDHSISGAEGASDENREAEDDDGAGAQ